MSIAPNAWMPELPKYEPGRPLEEVARELGLDDIGDIVKLASNENSLGPSPLAIAAMQETAGRMHLYPDGGGYYLTQALAERFDVDPNQVLLGNGSNELIELLGHVYLAPEQEIVMSQRAFVIYHLVAKLFNAKTIMVPMDGFTHDLDAMRAAITLNTRLVFVANPNNPTGTRVDNAALDDFILSMPDHVITVIDEAYVELLPPEEQPDVFAHVRAGRPVILLRTFSKGYGLAGLRLGYAIGATDCIELMNRARQPFNVNYMAQAAALAALQDDAHLQATRDMVLQGLEQLTQALDRMGIAYEPSCANFLLVNVGDGRTCFQALKERHVIVRPMDGYGLPEYIRVTVGTASENRRFIEAMAEILNPA